MVKKIFNLIFILRCVWIFTLLARYSPEDNKTLTPLEEDKAEFLIKSDLLEEHIKIDLGQNEYSKITLNNTFQ